MTRQCTDDVELDDLAAALKKAAEARDAQASPDLATLENGIAKALETLEWRRGNRTTQDFRRYRPLTSAERPHRITRHRGREASTLTVVPDSCRGIESHYRSPPNDTPAA